MGKDKLLGRVDLDLSTLSGGPLKAKWIPLQVGTTIPEVEFTMHG